ncbi:hypothetical protein BCV72DRAFT_309359 [Rhizopus microsporus var. microsporus]|uniref:Dipeptidyl aminopeptidase n=1 Tax=Rhizopus microsporus var. microsporus TaxID=86635 RepID=A0A1X0QR16_RHIZD|nr:hypothetical protein BCV72DRAFT_309359 [Rhizopus microsporus var. microsporus]
MPSESYFDEESVSDSQRLLSTYSQSTEDYETDEKYLVKEKSLRKKNFNWTCLGFLLILVIVVLLWVTSITQLLVEFSTSVNTEDIPKTDSKRLEFDDVFNFSFTVKRASLVWVENDPRDGIYTFRDPVSNDILIESIEDRKSEVFVEAKDLRIKDRLLDVHSFDLSHDSKYLLLRTNVTKQWRHSYLSSIYIYRRSDKALFPLTNTSTVDTEPKIAYAAWSPTGHKVAYVMNNDIYVTDLKSHYRITFDGSKTVFNGVPDWVYEEEVFATNFALWWSPDSTHIAFLKLDETEVPEYHLQLYTASGSSYPKETNIKYPKAGSPNPIVSLHVHSFLTNTTVDVTTSSEDNTILHANQYKDFAKNDRLIVDVAWCTSAHSHLLFKQTNRVQDHQFTNLAVLDPLDIGNSTVHKIQEYKPKDKGWIDIAQSMVYLPSNKSDRVQFLDIADNEEGFPHLAIVTVKDNGHTQVSWLTSGEWEVVSGTVEVDPVRQLVHFISTERSPYERHLYSISLKEEYPASSKVCITCPNSPDEHAYYSVSFSPKSGYYILNYEGPGIPNTVVKKVNDTSFKAVLEDNLDLRLLLRDYDLPKMHMKTITSDDVEMTAMEVVPPDFDASKKYPVLFHVYGGPGSQLVSYKFELSWQTFVASQLGFVVVTVDGRGTGFRGRDYRVGVRGRLGELEVIDQVNAGRHWASLDYVDEYRMAIWGWSYGGYMTTRVLEANSGVFSTGMAVAPVTDWRFYDSVYTERYMLTPKLNPQGYNRSAVNNMAGFKNAKYLLVHGTGDDNVHFQHSATLVDKLTLADIHNYRVHFFTDSDHAINYHNANRNVYYILTEFLLESFGGHQYKHIYSEANGKFSGPLPEEH